MEATGMAALAEIVMPGHRVVSTSSPEPALRRLNIVGSFASPDDARNAVLALESLNVDQESVGLTVIASSSDTVAAAPTSEPGLDPEGVGRDIRNRLVKGALIGAVVGAVVVGVVASIVAGSEAAPGGAVGGLLFGAAIGAMWGAFARLGGSDAFRESFVVDDPGQLMLVSLHTDSDDDAHEAAARFELAGDERPITVHKDGDGLRRA